MHSPTLNIPVEIIREILSHLTSPVSHFHTIRRGGFDAQIIRHIKEMVEFFLTFNSILFRHAQGPQIGNFDNYREPASTSYHVILVTIILFNSISQSECSRRSLTRHLKSLTIEAMDQPFVQEEISMLIRIVKSRTIIYEKNKGIMKERLQNLSVVKMPYSLAFPNELTALCTDVGVVFRRTWDLALCM